MTLEYSTIITNKETNTKVDHAKLYAFDIHFMGQLRTQDRPSSSIMKKSGEMNNVEKSQAHGIITWNKGPVTIIDLSTNTWPMIWNQFILRRNGARGKRIRDLNSI